MKKLKILKKKTTYGDFTTIPERSEVDEKYDLMQFSTDKGFKLIKQHIEFEIWGSELALYLISCLLPVPGFVGNSLIP